MSALFLSSIAILFLTSLSYPYPSSVSSQNDQFRAMVVDTVVKVANRSFPEIKTSKLRFKDFQSKSVFFKSRFSVCRYLTFRPMRHIIYYNPAAFRNGLPEEALEGIVAHELSHVLYYTEKNRLQLLGLAGLLDSRRNAEFERRADLEAIRRGYGTGLAEYREWLFGQIPSSAVAGKRRDYFSADEIRMISDAIGKDPGIAEQLRRHVPMNKEELNEILR